MSRIWRPPNTSPSDFPLERARKILGTACPLTDEEISRLIEQLADLSKAAIELLLRDCDPGQLVETQ